MSCRCPAARNSFRSRGTSLSKGFDLIERFSEDLDVKLEGTGLPHVVSWKSEGSRATKSRREYFSALTERLHVPGAEVRELRESRDPTWRSAQFAVHYPSRAVDSLPGKLRPFVQLEVGSARVTPGEEREITSWVHAHLAEELPGLAAMFAPNRPTPVHCLLPTVTLLEKVEAVSRRFLQDPFEPGTFIRHYEDVARILNREAPGLGIRLRPLLDEMLEQKDIRVWPAPDHPAWTPGPDRERWEQLEAAWSAITPIFWGERISLSDCCSSTQALLVALTHGNASHTARSEAGSDNG
jgi:hypothetical protein